jgi:hypothetical protein
MMSSTVWTCLFLSPVTLHSVSSVVSCCRVASHCSGAKRVVIVLVLYCRHTVDTCPHSMKVLTTLSAYTSYRRMMTLTEGALEMKRARVHWEHACLAIQTCLLGFSLCLKLAAHRDSWYTW